MSTTRRKFIRDSSAAAMAGTAIFASQKIIDGNMDNLFVHHVYFWLKNPGSKEDTTALLQGLKKLSAVSTIRNFHIGRPADTNRDVIDRSYALSWLALFDNKADQDSYQSDPIHLRFVEECSHLWEKVIVYDSVDA